MAASPTASAGRMAAGPDDVTIFEDTQFDAPDTPAHLFAVKAFKQALFGTPKPEERPIPRRKKVPPAADARGTQATSTKHYAATVSSPSKPTGILLTPGTGGARRKTVSFGTALANGMNNGQNNATTAMTPRDVPGGFPSPTVADNNEFELSKQPARVQRTLFPTSGVVEPKKVGQEGWKQPSGFAIDATAGAAGATGKSGDDATTDLTAPRSTSGKYWKQEFDDFSSKSTLEMRKMAKKEQIAKKYAKHKDKETLQLHDQLRAEQKKIMKLEKQVEDYLTKLQAATQREQPGPACGDKGKMASGKVPIDARDDVEAKLQKTMAALSVSEEQVATHLKSNTALQKSLTQSEAQNAELMKAVAALQRENEAMRKQLPRPAKLSTAATSGRQDFLSSDIWADLAAAEDGTLAGVAQNLPPRKHTGRSPLAHRHGNVASQAKNRDRVGGQKASDDVKSETAHPRSQGSEVSLERRQRLEAAKRRLALKKSQRCRETSALEE